MLKKIYRWLLPTFCTLCHTNTKGERLCYTCHQELPWQIVACTQCGLPLSHEQICGYCLKNPPCYDHTICLFHYQTPIDKLILSLKFAEKLNHAKLLGDLMAEKLAKHYTDQKKPDIIIPVPLHPKRLKERGYNQALEIARPVAKKLRIPIEIRHCKRILSTPPQSSVTAKIRRRNIKNAFSVGTLLKYHHVAIIDDVVTTGSTVTELARVLKKAGVHQIDIWCCARTPLINQDEEPTNDGRE